MDKIYNQQVFVNDTEPALSAENLNILTKAVSDIDDRVVDIGETVEDLSETVEGYADEISTKTVTASDHVETPTIYAPNNATVKVPKGIDASEVDCNNIFVGDTVDSTIVTASEKVKSKTILATNNIVSSSGDVLASGVSFLSRTGFPLTASIPSTLTDSASESIKALDVVGYSSQSGTPTPSAPIEIVDADGEITSANKNLYKSANTLDAMFSGGEIVSASNVKLVYAEVEASKTYTVSKKKGTYFRVGYSAEAPSIGVAVSSVSDSYTAESITYTVGSDAKYIIALVWYGGTDTSITADAMLATVQIEEGTTATSYVAHAENSITLPYTLRSIGDVKDEIIVNEDGSSEYIQRVGVTSLTVSLTASTSKAVAFSGISNAYGRLALISDKFSVAYSGDNYICINSAYSGLVMLSATDYSGDVTVYYPLATEVTTPLTSAQVSAIKALKTYKTTSVIECEVSGEMTYQGDIKAYIDNKLK